MKSNDEKIRFWVLVATILGSSMGFIDGTMVNVILPAIQSELSATMIDLQWVIEAYALFLAALILTGGSMGDRFGRNRIFATGIIIFAVASLWCGVAPSITELIIARSLQGLGGALMVPASLAILSANFDESHRGKAIGTWSAFSALMTGAGPVIGGFLADTYSWRLAFLINIPLAAIIIPGRRKASF